MKIWWEMDRSVDGESNGTLPVRFGVEPPAAGVAAVAVAAGLGFGTPALVACRTDLFRVNDPK